MVFRLVVHRTDAYFSDLDGCLAEWLKWKKGLLISRLLYFVPIAYYLFLLLFFSSVHHISHKRDKQILTELVFRMKFITLHRKPSLLKWVPEVRTHKIWCRVSRSPLSRREVGRKALQRTLVTTKITSVQH